LILQADGLVDIGEELLQAGSVGRDEWLRSAVGLAVAAGSGPYAHQAADSRLQAVWEADFDYGKTAVFIGSKIWARRLSSR